MTVCEEHTATLTSCGMLYLKEKDWLRVMTEHQGKGMSESNFSYLPKL
jgi:hypothetical protein